jgi:hypothetical protein
MRVLWILAGCLGIPGLLPALAVARRSPAVIFLAPLAGATMAAIAAILEVGVGGSLVTCYAAVAVLVNIAVIAWWRAAGRFRPWPSPPADWSVLTAAVILAAVALPLVGLRGHLTGWDTGSIWLTHALMLAGGHHQALTALRNPVYAPAGPDYPPLVPAIGALTFAVFGRGDLQLAVDVTVGLNACALGVAGAGVAALAQNRRAATRVAALAAAVTLCIAGFAVAGSAGIDGHADLAWAAAAVGAVIWGLVLPRSTQALVIAWICVAAASLTKNEGFTTALIVIILIAFRYVPLRLAWPKRSAIGSPSRARTPEPVLRWWSWRARLIVLPALPGLAWAGLARHLGLRDTFFAGTSAGSVTYRAGATVTALAGYLTIMLVALAVLAAGSVALRNDRERGGLGNPAWLWAAAVGSLVTIFATYVLGTPDIHWWLNTSDFRTTIFTRCLMYAELAVWLVIAADVGLPRTRPQPDPPHQHSQRDGTDHPAGQGQHRAAGHDAQSIARHS